MLSEPRTTILFGLDRNNRAKGGGGIQSAGQVRRVFGIGTSDWRSPH